MIYDIEKLIQVLDFRDQWHTDIYTERLAGLVRERQELEEQNTADQKEIRLRALALVERIDFGGKDVTREELQRWFSVDGTRRTLGKRSQVIYRNELAQEAVEREYAGRRLGELQKLLRARQELGVAIIDSNEIRAEGYQLAIADWFEKFNKAQARKRYDS